MDTLYSQNFGEVASYEAMYNATSLYSSNYERDHLGRITKQTETIEGETHIYEYFYYPTGWLHEVKKDSVTISTYTYDDNGNRLSYTPQSGPAINGTYDNQDRLTSYGTATYTYTKNGELLTKTANGQTTTYNYDVLGNLVSVTLPDGTLIEYIIDSRNRRVGKKVNGTLVQGFLYDSRLHSIAELDGSGTVVAIFGLGFMIKNGTTYRFITDHLGSIHLVVDTTTGTIAQQINYDEFGNILNDTNPGFQPFGFAGGVYDTDTGLVRFGARDYDAKTGRWTTKDRILFDSKDSNFYNYAIGDPINYYDLFGLDIVINETGRPLIVSGNPGPGNGTGPQRYAVIPSNDARHGGVGNPLPSFESLIDAKKFLLNLPCKSPDPNRLIFDIDFYYDNFNNRHKIKGDDEGPLTTIATDDDGNTIIRERDGRPSAYWRALNR